MTLTHAALPAVPVPQIITGERPQRGQLRLPRVPEECSQVRWPESFNPLPNASDPLRWMVAGHD